jgi:FkbM family methyltransferase
MKLAGALLFQAITHPRMALFALKERGLAYIVRRFITSDTATINTIARDLQFRSSPATRENLGQYYTDVVFENSDDSQHHLVRLPSGERFYIRIIRGWHDLGTLYDTFVRQIYGDHPDLAGKTVIDVGANIGDTAVYFAERGARVIAYEPDPEMCELARRNAKLNGLQIEFNDAGVGGANETLPLSTSRAGADSVSVTLFPGSRPLTGLHDTTMPVRIVAFSDVLATLESIGLLKMDCEGCEYPALRSVNAGELRKIDHIIMEYHERGDSLAALLRAAGFDVRFEGPMYMYAERRA